MKAMDAIWVATPLDVSEEDKDMLCGVKTEDNARKVIELLCVHFKIHRRRFRYAPPGENEIYHSIFVDKKHLGKKVVDEVVAWLVSDLERETGIKAY